MVWLALVDSALALSCVYGVYDSNVREGVDLPANAEIVVLHMVDDSDEISLSWTGPDGEPVPHVLELFTDHAVLVPEGPLAPGDHLLSTVADDGFTRSFEIGTEVHDTPPDAPVIVAHERHRERGEWGLTEMLMLEVEPPAPGVHHEVEIATDADFGDPQRAVMLHPSGWVGHGVCGSNVEAYEHGTDYHVRVRAVDLAGNTSDWVVEAPVGRPLDLGCTTVGGAPWASAWGLVLLGFARRRTR